jgi:hypothetical protein
VFWDHKSRPGVILVLQGPFVGYDGFILLPRSFDFFGPAVHGYDPFAFGSAGISSEALYLSPGAGGLAVTAADQSFAAFDTGANGFAGPQSGFAPAASNSPATTVYGQPMSVSQAHAIAQGLTSTPGSSAGAPARGGAALASGESLLLVVAIVVVASLVGAIATVEWVAHSRRR